MTSEIECPYCNKEQEIELEESGLDSGAENEKECECCEKTFIVQTEWIFSPTILKADHLNV